MPSPADIAAVRAVVDAYAIASAKGDPDGVRAAFHPKAVMNGYLGGQLLTGDVEPFAQALTAGGSSEATYHGEITSIAVAGAIASVTLAEDGLLGTSFFNHLQLIKIDGHWSIIAKLFTTVG